MNPLRAVHVVNKASDAQLRRGQVRVLVQGDFFFLGRADDSLGIAVLLRRILLSASLVVDLCPGLMIGTGVQRLTKFRIPQ